MADGQADSGAWTVLSHVLGCILRGQRRCGSGQRPMPSTRRFLSCRRHGLRGLQSIDDAAADCQRKSILRHLGSELAVLVVRACLERHAFPGQDHVLSSAQIAATNLDCIARADAQVAVNRSNHTARLATLHRRVAALVRRRDPRPVGNAKSPSTQEAAFLDLCVVLFSQGAGGRPDVHVAERCQTDVTIACDGATEHVDILTSIDIDGFTR